MSLNPNINLTDVDAQSPLDEDLMGAIRENLDRLDDAVSGSNRNEAFISFRLNGPLSMVPGGKARRVDSAYIAKEQTLTSCVLYLDRPGSGGSLEIDLRKVTTPNIPISAISHQFQATTDSIARAGTAYPTQSITRTAVQISTQSVTEWKDPINIASIISIGGGLWQYNLATALDSDWLVGDSVLVESCTSPGNNGSFVIVRINDYGSRSIVVANASGVAQTASAGTIKLKAFAYNFSNPAPDEYVVGEKAQFSAHTAAANNGQFVIYAVNSGGNNIVVKNADGANQESPGGTADVLRFSYNMTIPIGSDYVVGESVYASSHSSSQNNGVFKITAINAGGNNIQVYNPAGGVQGGAAGAIDTNRWIYAIPVNPTTGVAVGDTLEFEGHSSAYNNGAFVVKQVNRAATNNVVIYNESGVAQGGSSGTMTSRRKLIQFAADQASSISDGDFLEIEGCPSAAYNTPQQSNLGHEVLEVNRGGGANYNAVISVASGLTQESGAGWVYLVSRSIFTTRPKITVSPASGVSMGQTAARTNTTEPVIGENGALYAGEKLALYILSVPSGNAETLSVQTR